MAKILIIEDELELVKVLRSYLDNAGFEVVTALRGDTGLTAWQNEKPDLVLLDLNLPGMDGIEIAKSIRKQDNTPIIMLTARVEDTDRIVGLELGADDYVTKPFSPREVVARVKAVLRRAQPVEAPVQRVVVKDLEIDEESFKIRQARKRDRPDTHGIRHHFFTGTASRQGLFTPATAGSCAGGSV